MKEPVWIWGVPFAPLTLDETVEVVGSLIEKREPSYLITANLHYVMLSRAHVDLEPINRDAALVLADGAPVVKASRSRPVTLPQRVAGADLIFHLCERSATEGWRIFLLGAPPGVAEEAAEKLRERYPALQIVGTECPPYRKLEEPEHRQLIDRIRATSPDILFVAFGQPKGEKWIYENYRDLEVPVSVQVGASLEFAAGRFARAPRWMQRVGLEWSFRLMQEPRRLFLRYARNARFLARMKLLDRIHGGRNDLPRTEASKIRPRQEQSA